ncbi:MAG: hypothetical protein K9N21_13555 [Deltaproteobacteria bacterium]|nr:hypothetical protein [Deltaproteobacteria bacterium]
MGLIEIEESKRGTGPYAPDLSTNKYYSVEFSVNGSFFVHQFKIRNLTTSSIGVLVNENSEIIDLLRVGDVIKMKYYPKDSFLPPDLMDTEIRHIKKERQGRFNGHYLIGLAIRSQTLQEQLH